MLTTTSSHHGVQAACGVRTVCCAWGLFCIAAGAAGRMEHA